MIKSLHLYFYRYCLGICCFLLLSKTVNAQTNADALMIAKNYFCAGVEYSNNQWTNYWEGTFKRNNGNIGKLTTNTYTVVGNYGITNKLDVLFSVPYVTTNASAGTLKGQHGLQDFMLNLKYQAIKTKIASGTFSAYGILTGSIPLSNYEADFQPVSIGMHSKSVSVRALANYQVGKFFIAGAGQYTLRDDITIDRDSYYTDHLIYSNQVDMPNMSNYLVSTGYRSPHLNIEAMFEQMTTQGGFDIRKNDMPFPSNRMNMSVAGAMAKYSFSTIAGLELMAGANRVVAGRNVGQATTITGGALYLFDFSKHNNK